MNFAININRYYFIASWNKVREQGTILVVQKITMKHSAQRDKVLVEDLREEFKTN